MFNDFMVGIIFGIVTGACAAIIVKLIITYREVCKDMDEYLEETGRKPVRERRR
jgi:hypothetical protein